MTRTMIALLTTVALVVASSVTVPAQGKKGSTPKPQHVSSRGAATQASSQKTTKAGPKTTGGPKTSAPKTSAPKTTTVSQTSKGPKTTTAKATKPAKTTSSPSTKVARADAKSTTKSARADAKSTAKSARADRNATTSDTTGTSTTTPVTTPTTPGDGETPVTLTKVQEKLQKNTKLADRLEGRLPKGADLMEAADGFKNLGQFVAAVNVSSNLGLDFEKLKTAMVDDGRSLGQAIQSVKKDVENPTVVAQRAESEALTLIQQTEKTTATTSTTTTSTTSQKTKSKDKPKLARTGSGSK
jgi:hypothetical protein